MCNYSDRINRTERVVANTLCTTVRFVTTELNIWHQTSCAQLQYSDRDNRSERLTSDAIFTRNLRARGRRTWCLARPPLPCNLRGSCPATLRRTCSWRYLPSEHPARESEASHNSNRDAARSHSAAAMRLCPRLAVSTVTDEIDRYR